MARGVLHAVFAAVFLAIVSTFGDFLWDALRLRHRMSFGLMHGAVICLFIGLAIGARERRVLPGAAAGPLIGLLAAGGFYVLAPWMGWAAMIPMWMLFWLCFALLQWWMAGDQSLAAAAARGLAAAVLSGLAFYFISGIWTRPSPGGPDYLRHLWSWAFAFLPGFLALFVAREEWRKQDYGEDAARPGGEAYGE